MPRMLSSEGGAENSPLAHEARETSGVTSLLLLSYLDHVGGATAVKDVLDRCGLAGCEAPLRDENTWFSWQTKINLFEATAEVLGKPDFLEEMAALALDLNVGGGVRVAIRTLGSPQLVCRSIVRANARFNGSHAMELIRLGPADATVRFFDISGQHRFHPLDCQYSAAMLRLVPQLFGLPRAQLRHLKCIAHGDDACVYEIRWREHAAVARHALAATATTGGALTASLLFSPAALPAAIAVGVAAIGGLVMTELRRHRRAWQALEREATDNAEVAQRLFASLEDLVSDLRLDEVLAKVTRNAQAAVGGREFALLVRDGDNLICQSSSGLPQATVTALEQWANRSPGVASRSVVLDDVRDVPALTPLAETAMPLCSLASAPLTFFGEALGVLIALGTQSHTFLPRDLEVLQSFATQVAIAMHNARRYHVTKTQADVDGLTGLRNHRSFHEALDQTLAAPGLPAGGCLVLVDLDDFKRVNDEDGHGAGDRLLRAAAQAMAEACRGDDLAFRVGGDEFALVLPGLDEQAAAAVAARVCAAVSALDPRLGASAGVAALVSGRSKDSVLEQADELLYAAKRGERAGRARCASSTGAARVAAEILHAALELQDRPAAARSAEVADLSRRVAARLGAAPAECELARQAALAHELRERPELLARIPGLDELSRTVRATGERWDGRGRERIPLPARVVAACDAVLDIASQRPIAAALIELQRRAGSEFDPLVVRAVTSELATAPDHRAAA